MTPDLSGPPDPRGAARIGQQLCRAVGDVDFDYATLVQGVHQRAGRIRRRRALTTGAIVAVVGPALLGGSAVVLPDLLPGGVHGTVTPAETPVAALTDRGTDAADDPETTLLTEDTDADTGQDQGRDQGSADPQEPPWQDGDPPLPAEGVDSADSGNAWEIPDARPTGVAALDAFGAPQTGLDYQRVIPLMHVMVGNTGAEGQRPLAGQMWSYYVEDTSSQTGVIDINVTGWDDSVAARDALRDETMAAFVRDTDGPWQVQDWAGREGDDDSLLYTATAGGRTYGIALVRQGDYLVGVTVGDTTGGDTPGEMNAEVAADIADKTAANMEALDPIHGRD